MVFNIDFVTSGNLYCTRENIKMIANKMNAWSFLPTKSEKGDPSITNHCDAIHLYKEHFTAYTTYSGLVAFYHSLCCGNPGLCLFRCPSSSRWSWTVPGIAPWGNWVAPPLPGRSLESERHSGSHNCCSFLDEIFNKWIMHTLNGDKLQS